MNKNKRSSIRKPLDLYVDVYHFDEHLGRSQTRDISLDGAFIESCSRELCPNDMLDLRIHVQDDERNPLCLKGSWSNFDSEAYHRYGENRNFETPFKHRGLQAAVDKWCNIQVLGKVQKVGCQRDAVI